MADLIALKDMVHDDNTVVTVGTFDGVHEGHRALMETVVRRAEAKGARSVVVTFDPHPRTIINPKNSVKLLTSLQERADILHTLGVDILCVIPFTRDFSLYSSEAYVREVIYDRIGISEFVIGYDHHFGRDRAGTIETLEKLAPELGFDVQVVSRREMGDITISSTKIRTELQEKGDVVTAAQLLGRPYILNGLVIHGDERGRTIGFPTANLRQEHPDKIIPKNGIYAVKVRVDGTWFGGMMNIGVRPTFSGEDVRLEVHIFDFDQLIYGKTIQVHFIKRIRDEQKFASAEALVKQLNMDKKAAAKVLPA